MSYGLRLVVVALAAFSGASLLTSAIVPWVWRRMPDGAPGTRADLFFLLRLLPTIAGLLAAGVIAASFMAFEPPAHDERIGGVLTTMAVVALGAVAWTCFHLVRQWALARRIVAAWPRLAEPRRGVASLNGIGLEVVETAFPIVALVGIVRPRIVVARVVLDACSADEWQAVLAHEGGHLRRRDNLRRGLVAAAPDLLSWLPVGSRLAEAWHQAAEEAADEQALSLGERGRVLLAQALIRVARLAPRNATEQQLPASALYRGENIDRRVRGLLAPPLPPVTPPPVVWRVAAAAVALLFVAVTVGLVQAAIERAVEYLP